VPTRHSEAETVDLMAAMRERSAQRGRRRRPKGAEVPGLDNAPVDALPLEELAKDPREELPPTAHTHPEDDPEIIKEGPAERRIGSDAAARKARRAEPTQPVRQSRPSPERPSGRRRSTNAGATDRQERQGRPERQGSADNTPPEATDDEYIRRSDIADLTDDVPDDPTGDMPDDGPDETYEPRGSRGARAPEEDADLSDVSELADGTDGEVLEPRVAARASKPASTRRSGRPSVPSWDDIMFGRRTD
jgi:hypothetical protein